jgi:hypothetical protein
VTATRSTPNTTGKRALTEKEVAARRANAAKSTGPRSAEGKAKVARNAVKHGAYQQKVSPISSGPLAEDPAEVVEFVRAIIDELDPQSPIESALARDIGELAWRQRRVSEFENLALVEFRSNWEEVNKLDNLRVQLHNTQLVADALDDLDADEIGMDVFEEVACRLLMELDDEDVPGWTDTTTPATAAEWRVVIDWIVSKKHKTRAAAAEDTRRRVAHLEREAGALRSMLAPMAAKQALDGNLLTKTTDISGRLRRDLMRMLDQYEEVKARKAE